MAIEVRSPISGQYPITDDQFATVGYVEDTARDIPLNPRTASYTLVLSDRGRCVQMNSSSALTVTVPPNSSVAFPVGAVVYVRRYGSGTVTVAQGSGVVVRGTLTLGAQYSTAWLHKVATDEWILST